jgi:hypothetical protein
MRGVEGKVGKRRFGFSYGLLLIAIVTYLGTWGYSSGGMTAQSDTARHIGSR